MLMDIAEASKERQTQSVRFLLQNSPEIARTMLEDTDQEYKGTALYWMCVNGELDIVSRLLEAGADVNSSNIYKHTPLHAASDMGFTNIVKLLLKYGARMDVQNENEQTPLHLAAYRGYHEIVESLLKAGANDRIKNYRHLTPLQESVSRNHKRVSTLLCGSNSNLTSVIPSGGVSTKVPLTRTRSHSPKIGSTLKGGKYSLPTVTVHNEDQRFSLPTTIRRQSGEHILVLPQRVHISTTLSQLPQCRTSATYSQQRIFQPYEQTE